MTPMTPGLLIGVDLGTTRIKAVAVDTAGEVRGQAERPTPWQHAGGRTEIDPDRLAETAADVAAAAAEAGSSMIKASLQSLERGEGRLDHGSGVLGVGVTGMAETGVLVDGSDRPLTPAIAWHDPRGDLDTIARELGTDAFQRATGLPLTPLPSLGKLLWLRRRHPDLGKPARFYSVSEWVVRRLGGEPVAELSLASRTGLLDLAAARPWDAAADLLGWPALLPEPVPAGTPAGRVGDERPVLRGAVLTVAGHDHQVAAYGVGAATDGALFDSLGTAEALVRTIRAPLPPDRVGALAGHGASVGWGVRADHLSVMAGLPTGLTLNRIAALLGATTTADRRALSERALAAPEHPTLRLVDPTDERFGLAGITDEVTPEVLWRVAVDGLVAAADEALNRIDALAGPYREVVVGGGWLHDPALLAGKRRQFPAMRTTRIAEPGAYGAALLAARAAGVPLTDGR
ncbi:FGGY family carbohydrate kinase [Actinomycetes bacterium KLBMP 9797]